jgi:P27 family predicted phage terminase small subunit
VKGGKPRTPLAVISSAAGKRSAYACPPWLPTEARAEWDRAVRDLRSRGLLFDGALASLEHYVLCVAQIRQLQAVMADQPIATTDGVHPAFNALQKAMQSARLLAVELGLTVVSRTRSYQGKSAGEREWDELDVG